MREGNTITFRKRNLFVRLFMPQEKLNQYYRDKRKYEYENNIPFKGIKLRNKIHKLALGIVKTNNHLEGITCRVLHDERIPPTDSPVIYACTHIGRYDVEVFLDAIKNPVYLFFGDPNGIYKSVLGFLVWLNGVLYLDTAYKEDRMIAKEMGIRLLNQGGSLAIFPEGAWNVTENEVVMKLFGGTVEMAIRSEVDIIPVAIDQRGKSFCVNIGKNIKCRELSMNRSIELTNELRDVLCTLKWEIWEQYGISARKEIPEGYSQTFIDQIMAESNTGYTLEDIIATRYRDKRNISPEEAFSFKDKLIPNRNNLFLLKALYRKSDQ